MATRLPAGLTIKTDETFGELRFSAMRREVYKANPLDGKPTNEVEKRTYDLKSSVQQCMIQVSVPGDEPLKEFPYNSVVKLVGADVGTVATASFSGVDVDWYCNAADIVLKDAPAQNAGQKQGQQPQHQHEPNKGDKKE